MLDRKSDFNIMYTDGLFQNCVFDMFFWCSDQNISICPVRPTVSSILTHHEFDCFALSWLHWEGGVDGWIQKPRPERVHPRSSSVQQSWHGHCTHTSTNIKRNWSTAAEAVCVSEWECVCAFRFWSLCLFWSFSRSCVHKQLSNKRLAGFHLILSFSW